MRTVSIKQLMQRFKVRNKRMRSLKAGSNYSAVSSSSYEGPLADLFDCWRTHKFDISQCTTEIEALKQAMSNYSPSTHHHKPTINFHLQQALKERLKKS
jgi:hypothetical protein